MYRLRYLDVFVILCSPILRFEESFSCEESDATGRYGGTSELEN